MSQRIREPLRHALRDYLQSKMGDEVEVKLYTSADAFKRAKQFPFILIGNAGTSRTTPEGVQHTYTPVVQVATFRFVATLYFKDLRTFEDAENTVEDLVDHISGFTPDTVKTKFYTVGDNPEGRPEGLWRYQIQFAAQVPTRYTTKTI